MAKAIWDMLFRRSEEEANKLKMDSQDLARKADRGTASPVHPRDGFTGGYIGRSESKIHMAGRPWDAGITCLVPLGSTTWARRSTLLLVEYQVGFSMQPNDLLMVRSDEVHHGSIIPILLHGGTRYVVGLIFNQAKFFGDKIDEFGEAVDINISDFSWQCLWGVRGRGVQCTVGREGLQ